MYQLDDDSLLHHYRHDAEFDNRVSAPFTEGGVRCKHRCTQYVDRVVGENHGDDAQATRDPTRGGVRNRVVNGRVLCLDLVGHRADMCHGDRVGGVGVHASTADELSQRIA